jgi:phosphate acetyltransferase
MMSLTQSWLERCRANPRRIVLPESTDPRTVEAAARLASEKAAGEIILVGDRAATMKIARASLTATQYRDLESGATWTFDDTRHARDITELTARTVRDHAARRGKTLDNATLDLQAASPLYQAGAMVQSGRADCALAGAVATTADVIRAALATTGVAPGLKTVSGSFIMESPENSGRRAAWLYADSGVVIDPDVQQLVDIAAASVKTWTDLVPACGFRESGDRPVVAFLSFSTKGSASHPAAEKMAAAAKLFSEKYPGIDCDGELQFDAAIDAAIAARKCPSSPAAGRANVFIFPDLGAGNIAYKITQRVAGFHAYGPILQGLAKPYSDLSRGSTPHDIFMSAMLNMLRA